MPVATLTFQLPEEADDFEQCLKSNAYRAAFGDVWNKVRSKLKYESPPAGQAEAYEQVRSWFVEACNEWEVEVP